jgi:transposase
MEMDSQTIHIEVAPLASKQDCPICGTEAHVIRKGGNRTRKIRHCDAFGKTIYLLAPAIRLFCNKCQCGYVWRYAFVEPGKRYSRAFEQQALHTAAATVKQSAELHEMPANTLQRKHQAWLSVESERLQKRAWHEAVHGSKLVLGIDDFAIRKGHTYNTGIHHLKGETLLDILPGRNLDIFGPMPRHTRSSWLFAPKR